VEKHAKEEEGLKERADIHKVDDMPDLPAPAIQKRGQDVRGNENGHPHSADAMQDIGQEWTLSLVSQSGLQAYVPIQAH
jgi:hypothetical protein